MNRKQGIEPNFEIVYTKFEPLENKNILCKKRILANSLLHILYNLEKSTIKLNQIISITNLQNATNFNQQNLEL